MSRKSLLLGAAILLMLAVVVTASLLSLMRHEKDFYATRAVPPSLERQRDSEEFLLRSVQVYQSIANGDSQWEEHFTEHQINSYFAEGFLTSGISAILLPEGVSEPRVALEADRIRLGFRYGKKPWSTVITLDLRVWLAKKETNVVAVEIQGLHAGGLPISAQSLLERFFEGAQRSGFPVTWYHYNGNPVALLHFEAGQPRPTVKLERLHVHEGILVISGRSVEPSPLRAMLSSNGPWLTAE
jgi:hypothetical protein